jgi:UDP-N-acetylmuramoylalanine-D-glutamate ligase
MPDNGTRIGRAIRDIHPAGHVTDADSLEAAVRRAYGWAHDRADAVVLLSPAAPSFGRFGDYGQRAEAFARAAAECGALT